MGDTIVQLTQPILSWLNGDRYTSRGLRRPSEDLGSKLQALKPRRISHPRFLRLSEIPAPSRHAKLIV